MKQRVISAIVALLIIIPIILRGGVLYDICAIILALLGLKEFLGIRETKKEIPIFIHFISYIILTLLVITGINQDNLIFKVDYRVLAALILVFLIPTVMYHKKEKYSVNDAFYLLGGVFFLGISFSLLIIIRNISLLILIYILLITIMTDTYAYIIGRLIGKTKLLETISPNKTWEGLISGSIVGTFIASVYFKLIVNPSCNILLIIFVTLFLSILGQLGDLSFSAIKRYFGQKDFSNIMPGHGGILDRLDSLMFVTLAYLILFTVI